MRNTGNTEYLDKREFWNVYMCGWCRVEAKLAVSWITMPSNCGGLPQDRRKLVTGNRGVLMTEWV